MSNENTNRDLYIAYALCLISIFALRICLSNYFTLYGDLNVFVGWGSKITKVGFSDFYSTYWCDYMPGYLYILWFLDWIHSTLPGIDKEILYKLPANIGDLILSVLVFVSLRNFFSVSKSFLASIIYYLNPAVIANSTFWGQIDSLHALPIVLSCLFALRKRVVLSSMFITLGFLIKPQTIIFFPVIAAIIFIPLIRTGTEKRQITKKLLLFIFSMFITTLVIVLPFIIKDIVGIAGIFIEPINFIIERFMGSYGEYEKASLNAFNFWGIFAMWENDQTKFLGLTYQTWGTSIFSMFYLIIFLSLLDSLIKTFTNYKKNFALAFEAISIVSFIAFLFLTRVHERHLMTTIVFLSFIAITSRHLIYLYITICFIYLLNLIYAFGKLTTYKTEFSRGYFKAIIFMTSSVLILSLVFLIIDFMKNNSFVEKLSAWKRRSI